MEQRIPYVTDPYDMAIITYALHLTNSPSKDYAYEKLMANATRGVYLIYLIWYKEMQC